MTEEPDKRLFVSVEFKPDGRRYTYHSDLPLFVGDRVKVTDFRDPTAWQRATVVAIDVAQPAPPIVTKSILGRIEDAAPIERGDDSDLFGGAH